MANIKISRRTKFSEFYGDVKKARGNRVAGRRTLYLRDGDTGVVDATHFASRSTGRTLSELVYKSIKLEYGEKTADTV